MKTEEEVDISFIPEELEHKQVSEKLLTAAYELTPAQQRVWIKTNLMLGEKLYMQPPDVVKNSQIYRSSALHIQTQTEPVSWVLLLIDKSYLAASRLAAAIIAAQIAGVEQIIAVLICPESMDNEYNLLLTTLELSGIEDILDLTYEETNFLISYITTTYGIGKILQFSEKKHFFAPIKQSPCWHDKSPLRLAIEPKAMVDIETIQWAHTNAIIEEVRKSPYKNDLPDALYCSIETKEHYLTYNIPCILGPGLEGCWMHASLPISFFHKRTVSISIHTTS